MGRESTTIKIGTYSARLRSGSGGEHIEIYQDISDYANYLGKRLTFMAWVRASQIGAYVYISTASGVVTASVGNKGLGTWERLRVMADIPTTATRIKVGIMWDPKSINNYCYADGCALVLGDTCGRIELTEANVYPVESPEDVLISGGVTADGELFFVEDGVNIIIRRLNFETILEELYLRIRNFYRYAVEGPTYSFEYTDREGITWSARMLRESLSDAKKVGSGLYTCSLSLRLTDKGR